MKTLATLLPFFALAAPALAQQISEARPLPQAPRHAGVYHMATGTWTRTASSSAAGASSVIYNNFAPSGYFSTLGSEVATGDYSIIDVGRVPTTSSAIMGTAPVERDAYSVNRIEFAYCSGVQGPNVAISFNFYDTYLPCDLVLTDPLAPFHLANQAPLVASGLPGSSFGGIGCWVMSLDLSGGNEFCLIGDGGPVPSVSKAFGVETTFVGAAGSSTGFILAGDPTSTGSVAGADMWGGGGTYYDSMNTCSGDGTGLDTEDQILIDGDNAPLAPGCYFFGGYLNTNGCGGPSNNPFSSISLRLYSDLAVDPDCSEANLSTFCEPAGINSSGTAVTLSAATIASGSGVQINARGGPAAGSMGFFVVAAGSGQGVSIGQGTLCLDPRQGRYTANSGATLNSLGTFDGNGDFTNLSSTSISGFGFDIPSVLPDPPTGSIAAGSTWHFQLWYTDMNPSSTSNFSDGLAITF